MSLTRTIPFDWRFGLALLGLIVVLALAWYLGSPLVLNRSVAEALPTTVATEPRPIAQGSFGIVDGIHHGQGTASLLDVTDGTRVLRFSDFAVTNGPDLYVYLSANPAPRTGAQLHEGGAFEVAALKGNAGDQNYTLPADLNLDDFEWVVIYCRRFSVVFSSAPLRTGASMP